MVFSTDPVESLIFITHREKCLNLTSASTLFNVPLLARLQFLFEMETIVATAD